MTERAERGCDERALARPSGPRTGKDTPRNPAHRPATAGVDRADARPAGKDTPRNPAHRPAAAGADRAGARRLLPQAPGNAFRPRQVAFAGMGRSRAVRRRCEEA